MSHRRRRYRAMPPAHADAPTLAARPDDTAEARRHPGAGCACGQCRRRARTQHLRERVQPAARTYDAAGVRRGRPAAAGPYVRHSRRRIRATQPGRAVPMPRIRQRVRAILPGRSAPTPRSRRRVCTMSPRRSAPTARRRRRVSATQPGRAAPTHLRRRHLRVTPPGRAAPTQWRHLRVTPPDHAAPTPWRR